MMTLARAYLHQAMNELRRHADDSIETQAAFFSLPPLLRTEAELDDSFVAYVRKVAVAFVHFRVQNSDDGDTLEKPTFGRYRGPI